MSELLPPPPYKGLTPYGEEDAMFFFGREDEKEVLKANLRAYPLTVLYGATGVGKSSVLRAGVAHQLRDEAAANIDDRGEPEWAVAVVSSWHGNPLKELRRQVELAVRETLPGFEVATEPVPDDIGDALIVWGERVGGSILVILDQFEEYFLYPRKESEGPTFASEFPRLVNSPDIHVNFLVAVREDALAWLDRFKTSLPNLLDNYVRIKHLDQTAARRAIVGPLERYNRECPPSSQVTIEDDLIDTVLHDIRYGELELGARGKGLRGYEPGSDEPEGTVETPFLQLVMRRVWDAEMAEDSRTLRLATLTQRLGGARHIVKTHLNVSMSALPREQQRVAAKVFQYLVTPSGTKIAHIPADLALYTRVEEAQLAPVLARLAHTDLRILRRVPAPSGGEVAAYEIFHDVLAPAILGWQAQQAEEEARADLERRLSEERAEALRWKRQQELALSNKLAANAQSQLRVDPELSVLLAVEAVKISETPTATVALRQSLFECRIHAVMRGHTGEVSRAAFSPDGTLVVTAAQDATARLWDAATGQRLHMLAGHDDWVWSACFSPDGGRVVTASSDHTARLWEVASGAELAVLRGHQAEVRAAVFSPDGQRVVTVSDDHTARLWDVGQAAGQAAVEPLVLRGHKAEVRAAAFTPDGRLLVTAGFDGAARVWTVADGRCRRVLAGHTALLWGVATSPDSRLAVTASQDRTARLWDLATGRCLHTLEGHLHEVWCAQFSPDATLVATASFDQTARVWDVATGQTLSQLQRHTHSLYSVSFSPDGEWVVTASLDGTAAVHEARRGRTVTVFRGHSRGVNWASFSPDGERVVTTSQDKTARIWDVDTGQSSLQLTGHDRSVINVSFSADSSRLVTAGGDHAAVVWEVRTGRAVLRLEGHDREVSSAVFSPDPAGARIATASWDRTAIVWDTASGAQILRLKGHAREVTTLAFTPDGTRLVTGSRDKTVRVWSLAAKRTILTIDGHDEAVTCLAVSPDGTLLATASEDGTACVWDLKTGTSRGQLQATTEALRSIGFSPDGRRVVTASEDYTARIWNLGTGRAMVLRGHTGRVQGAAFSPDGTLVVTASEDRTARVWDADRGEPLADLRGHSGPVTSAAFSPDGNWWATGSDDLTARLYPRTVRSSVEDLLARARDRVTRELTEQERARYIPTTTTGEQRPTEIIS